MGSHSSIIPALQRVMVALGMLPEGRKLDGWYRRIFDAICVVFAVLFLYTAGPPVFGVVGVGMSRGLFVLLTVVLILMKFPATQGGARAKRPSLFDGLLIAVSVVTFGYWAVEFNNLILRVGSPASQDIVLGTVAIVLSLEVTRRVLGPAISIIAAVFILYAALGSYAPFPFTHRGFNWSHIASLAYSMQGIYGMVLDITATYIVPFVIFGGLLGALGASTFFVEFPYALTAGIRGGPAQTAVVASALFGSISGSATANTAATGTFTIPLMIRAGYRRHVAGAIEPAASTGGMFMPPVMGAGAFLMAELLGVPYNTIVKVALVPALIYFFSVGVIVYLEAKRQEIPTVPRSERANPWPIFLKGWYYLFPVALILVLLFHGYSAPFAMYFTILATIVVAGSWKIFVENRDQKAAEARRVALSVVGGLREGGNASLTVGALVGSVGIILAVIFLTGIGFIFTTSIMDLTGGSVFVALMVAGLIAYVLGMGMTVTSVYLLLAILVANALVRLGVDPLAAHFALFWFSQTSNVSPPICIAAYVGAGIAKADPFQTGMTSMKYSAFLLFMPFVFVYGPILMKDGFTGDVAWAMFSTFVSTVPYGAAVTGYFVRRCAVWERLLLLATAITMVVPELFTDVLGFALLIAIYLYQARALPFGLGRTRKTAPHKVGESDLPITRS